MAAQAKQRRVRVQAAVAARRKRRQAEAVLVRLVERTRGGSKIVNESPTHGRAACALARLAVRPWIPPIRPGSMERSCVVAGMSMLYRDRYEIIYYLFSE